MLRAYELMRWVSCLASEEVSRCWNFMQHPVNCEPVLPPKCEQTLAVMVFAIKSHFDSANANFTHSHSSSHVIIPPFQQIEVWIVCFSHSNELCGYIENNMFGVFPGFSRNFEKNVGNGAGFPVEPPLYFLKLQSLQGTEFTQKCLNSILLYLRFDICRGLKNYHPWSTKL
jgi:hypothetical protein